MNRCRSIYVLVLIGVIGIVNNQASADTVFLRDGSVLNGDIKEVSSDRIRLAHDVLGALSLTIADVLYHVQQDKQIYTEDHTVTLEDDSVLTRLTRPVPKRQGQAESFRLLIPGQVLSVSDTLNRPMDVRKRTIGDNTLLTIPYHSIGAECDRMIVLTRQAKLIRTGDDMELVLQLNYTLAEPRTIKISVTYPQQLSIRSISPEPILRKDGVIIWEASLQRQQQYKPRVVFGSRSLGIQ